VRRVKAKSGIAYAQGRPVRECKLVRASCATRTRDWGFGDAWKERQLGGSWSKSFESLGAEQEGRRGAARKRRAIVGRAQLSGDLFGQISCITLDVGMEVTCATLVDSRAAEGRSDVG